MDAVGLAPDTLHQAGPLGEACDYTTGRNCFVATLPAPGALVLTNQA